MQPFFKLWNTGTSEGVKKEWVVRKESEDDRNHRLAAQWIHRYAWDTTLKSVARPEIRKIFHQLKSKQPITLYRFEREDHDPQKAELGHLPFESWTHNKKLAEESALDYNADLHGMASPEEKARNYKPKWVVRSHTFDPHSVEVDFTRLPKKTREYLSQNGGDSNMQEVLTWRHRRPSWSYGKNAKDWSY